MAISARPYGQRAVLKFAQYTGCLSIAGRFTPGTFTNQITKQFREPRLLIITDPRPDAQVCNGRGSEFEDLRRSLRALLGRIEDSGGLVRGG